MAIRVTDFQRSSDFLARIQDAYAGATKAQAQLSSGLRITTASDDPWGTGQALTLGSQLADLSQYRRTISDTRAMLDVADTALDGASSAMQRVRDLVLQGSNTMLDQPSRNAIAAEIAQLKEEIRSNMNARVGDEYLFSGTTTNTQPFPAALGTTYQGNMESIQRRVSEGTNVTVNVDGYTAFGETTGGGGTPDLMSTLDLLDRIGTDLTSGNPADLEELRTTALDAVDARMQGMRDARGSLGAVASRLDDLDSRLSSIQSNVIEARSKIVDVDMAEAYTDFQTQSTMYQAALAASSRLMNTSLLDFLK